MTARRRRAAAFGSGRLRLFRAPFPRNLTKHIGIFGEFVRHAGQRRAIVASANSALGVARSRFHGYCLARVASPRSVGGAAPRLRQGRTGARDGQASGENSDRSAIGIENDASLRPPRPRNRYPRDRRLAVNPKLCRTDPMSLGHCMVARRSAPRRSAGDRGRRRHAGAVRLCSRLGKSGLRPLGGAAEWWLARSLASLASDLAAIGARLDIVTGPSEATLLRLAQACQASHVFWTRRYGRGRNRHRRQRQGGSDRTGRRRPQLQRSAPARTLGGRDGRGRALSGLFRILAQAARLRTAARSERSAKAGAFGALA